MSDTRPVRVCPICDKPFRVGRWNTFTYCTPCIGFSRREAIANSIRYARDRRKVVLW